MTLVEGAFRNICLFCCVIIFATTFTAVPGLAARPPALPDERIEDPPNNEQVSGPQESAEVPAFRLDHEGLTDPSPAPGFTRQPIARAKMPWIYRYRRSLSVLAGTVNGLSGLDDIQYLFGSRFSFATESDALYEAGADVLTNGRGTVHFARRLVFGRSQFRPYAKAGVGVDLDPREGLTGILRLENFQARAALGAEQSLTQATSVRFEVEALISGRLQQALALMGLTWAW